MPKAQTFGLGVLFEGKDAGLTKALADYKVGVDSLEASFARMAASAKAVGVTAAVSQAIPPPVSPSVAENAVNDAQPKDKDVATTRAMAKAVKLLALAASSDNPAKATKMRAAAMRMLNQEEQDNENIEGRFDKKGWKHLALFGLLEKETWHASTAWEKLTGVVEIFMGLRIARWFTSAVKQAAEFQDVFARLRVGIGMTQDQAESYINTVAGIGPALMMSAQETAEFYNELLQLGGGVEKVNKQFETAVGLKVGLGMTSDQIRSFYESEQSVSGLADAEHGLVGSMQLLQEKSGIPGIIKELPSLMEDVTGHILELGGVLDATLAGKAVKSMGAFAVTMAKKVGVSFSKAIGMAKELSAKFTGLKQNVEAVKVGLDDDFDPAILKLTELFSFAGGGANSFAMAQDAVNKAANEGNFLPMLEAYSKLAKGSFQARREAISLSREFPAMAAMITKMSSSADNGVSVLAEYTKEMGAANAQENELLDAQKRAEAAGGMTLKTLFGQIEAYGNIIPEVLGLGVVTKETTEIFASFRNTLKDVATAAVHWVSAFISDKSNMEALSKIIHEVGASILDLAKMAGDWVKKTLSDKTAMDAIKNTVIDFGKVIVYIAKTIGWLSEKVAWLIGKLSALGEAIDNTFGDGMSGKIIALTFVVYELWKPISWLLGAKATGWLAASSWDALAWSVNKVWVGLLNITGAAARSRAATAKAVQALDELQGGSKFAQMAEEAEESASAVSKVTGAVGEAGEATSSAARYAGMFAEPLVEAEKSATWLSKIGGWFGKALKFLKPFGEALGVIFATVGAIGESSKDWVAMWKDFGKGNILDGLMDAVYGLRDAALGAIKGILSGWVDLAGTIVGWITGDSGLAQRWTDSFDDAMDNVYDYFTVGWMKLANYIVESFMTVIRRVKKYVINPLATAWDVLSEGMAEALSWLPEAFGGVSDQVVADLNKAHSAAAMARDAEIAAMEEHQKQREKIDGQETDRVLASVKVKQKARDAERASAEKSYSRESVAGAASSKDQISSIFAVQKASVKSDTAVQDNIDAFYKKKQASIDMWRTGPPALEMPGSSTTGDKVAVAANSRAHTLMVSSGLPATSSKVEPSVEAAKKSGGGWLAGLGKMALHLNPFTAPAMLLADAVGAAKSWGSDHEAAAAEPKVLAKPAFSAAPTTDVEVRGQDEMMSYGKETVSLLRSLHDDVGRLSVAILKKGVAVNLGVDAAAQDRGFKLAAQDGFGRAGSTPALSQGGF